MADDPTLNLADRPRGRRASAFSRFTRSVPGVIGLGFLTLMFLACVVTMPLTMRNVTIREYDAGGAIVERKGPPRYAMQDKNARHLPPSWWPAKSDPNERWLPADAETAERLVAVSTARAMDRLARERHLPLEQLEKEGVKPAREQVKAARPFYFMGTDLLGQTLFVRVLAGGGISLGIGLAAAMLSVFLGTTYGTVAGYFGGRTDAVMMRIVDILYGLPYVLLVVLLAVAGDAVMEEYISRSGKRAGYVRAEAAAMLSKESGNTPSKSDTKEWLGTHPQVKDELETLASKTYPPREVSERTRTVYSLTTLLVAIGGVSWLTMARVVRGQVLSLKSQPFMEAARAIGVPLWRQFLKHLLPNLVGPIIVYATLTVPQAILQESFLSFLGIGVRAPLPSWGNLAADGLNELNPYKSHWWLLAFPCLLLGTTLLALNFVGEGLREALDPKRARR